MNRQTLLEKYFSGTATPEETEMVQAYLADEQANNKDLEEVLGRYTMPDDEGPLQPVQSGKGDKLLLQLRQRLYPHLTAGLEYTIPTTDHDIPVIPMERASRRRSWQWLSAAAVLLFIATSAWWWMMPGQPVHTAQWANIVNNSLHTHYQQLPDGSQVWLQPHSRLSYVTNALPGEERQVKLTGECFFDVAHDSSRPFIVGAAGTFTRVLGTAFNIEAYEQESTVRVSLLRGKVALSDTLQHRTVMQAGSLLVYDRFQKRSHTTPLVASQQSFTDGTLVMHNIPVKDALQRVAGRFGLSLSYDAQVHLADKYVDGTFKDQPVEEMLHIILFVSGYHYQLRNKTIHIY